MNIFTFVGNLTRDPESSVMQNGKTQTKFSIAMNRPYKDAEGKQGADFVRITCYEKTAENCAKYLSKGRKVGVVGHVKTGQYEKDGKTIYTTDFIAENVEFLSSGQADGQGEGQQAATAPAQSQPPIAPQNAPYPAAAGYSGYTSVEPDDLPF